MKRKTQAFKSDARFSACKKFRYELTRTFVKNPQRWVNFIMLNPSTADADYNDPTIARCENFAIDNGFDGLIVTNLSARRATKPVDLIRFLELGYVAVLDYENFSAIRYNAYKAEQIICAWGNHGKSYNLSSTIKEVLEPFKNRLYYLQMNKSGEPKHPLYVERSCKPKFWDWYNV